MATVRCPKHCTKKRILTPAQKKARIKHIKQYQGAFGAAAKDCAGRKGPQFRACVRTTLKTGRAPRR